MKIVYRVCYEDFYLVNIEKIVRGVRIGRVCVENFMVVLYFIFFGRFDRFILVMRILWFGCWRRYG